MKQKKYLNNSQTFPKLVTGIKPPIRKLRKQMPSRILENLQSKAYHIQTAEKQRKPYKKMEKVLCIRITVYF